MTTDTQAKSPRSKKVIGNKSGMTTARSKQSLLKKKSTGNDKLKTILKEEAGIKTGLGDADKYDPM